MKLLLLDGNINFLKYFSSKGDIVYITSPLKYHYILFSRFPKKFFYLPYTGYDITFFKPIPNDKIINNLLRFLFEKFVVKEKVDFITAFSERTIYPLLINKKYKFPLFGLPQLDSFLILNDKSQLLRRIRNYAKSFSLPESFTNYKDIIYPCVIRGNISAASRLLFICKDYHDVKKAEIRMKNTNRKPMIEKFIKGEGWAMFNLLLDQRSKIKRALILGTKIENKKLYKILKEIELFLRDIRFVGFCSPQFIISNGDYYLTEINPRLSVNYFGLDFELNFPEAFEELFINGNTIKKSIKIEEFKGFINSTKIYLKNTMDFLIIPRYLELELERNLFRLIL